MTQGSRPCRTHNTSTSLANITTQQIIIRLNIQWWNQVKLHLCRVHIHSYCALKCHLTYIYVAQNTGRQTGYWGAREKKELHELGSEEWPDNTRCGVFIQVKLPEFTGELYIRSAPESKNRLRELEPWASSESWSYPACYLRRKVLLVGWHEHYISVKQCCARACVRAVRFLVQCGVCTVDTVREATMILLLSKNNTLYFNESNLHDSGMLMYADVEVTAGKT